MSRALRHVLTAVLLLAVLVLAPATVGALWFRGLVASPDGYVDLSSALSRQASVRSAVSTVVADRVVAAICTSALGPLVSTGERQQVRDAIAQVLDGVLVSGASSPAWRAAAAEAHRSVVALLSAPPRTGAGSGAVRIDLAPVIAAIKPQLTAQGIPFVDQIPDIRGRVTLFTIHDLPRAQRAYQTACTVSAVAPWALLAAVVLLLLVAVRRWLAFLLGAVAAGVGLALLAVALVAARDVAVAQRPHQLSLTAASEVYDALVQPLRDDLRVAGLVCAALAVVGAVGLAVAGRRRPVPA